MIGRWLAVTAVAAWVWCGRAEEKPAFVAAADGRAWADIVLPEKPLPVERYAADELKHHLDKATGLAYEIVNEGTFDPSRRPYHFYVGATKAAAAAGLPGRTLSPDERFLRTVGNGLYLLGRDGGSSLEGILATWCVNHVGTLYAVYDFLETELGVAWIWPGETGEVVPRRPSLGFKTIDRSGIEPLAERFWHGSAPWGDKIGFSSVAAFERFYREQARFLVRHRVGRRVNANINHHFEKWWDRFGKTHPEYFNLLCDGQRRPFASPSLVTMCCSEPGVWKQRAADWKEWWETTGKPNGSEPIVCCCENDSAGLCRCANCRAWDAPDPRFDRHPYWNGKMTHEDLENLRKQEGSWGLSGFVGDNRWDLPKVDPKTKNVASLSDRYANFYNHIQAEVAKVNPQARVVGYAYENYIEAPKKTRLDPRVLIEYVPRSYFPYDQAESDFFRTTLLGWKAAGMRDFNYRPNYMLAGGNYPFDQGRLILADFAFAYTNGMRACMFDSLRGSWSAHALMDYALVRAFRDPTHGYERARQEMLSAFGAAAESVGKYLDAVRRHTESWTEPEVRRLALANVGNGLRGGSFGNPTGFIGEFFDDAFFTRGHARLDEAVRRAGDDAEAVARIGYLRKGLRDAELTRKVRLAQKALKADPGNAAKQAAFDAAFKAMNDYRASVEDDLVCNFKSAARRELTALGWPHKVLEEQKK